MRQTAALLTLLALIPAAAGFRGFRSFRGGVPARARVALRAKKGSGQRQQDLMRQLEEARRQKEAGGGADGAGEAQAGGGGKAELPKANASWRESAAAEAIAEKAAKPQDYAEMEALLGSVSGSLSGDVDVSNGLINEAAPQDPWSSLLDSSGSPVTWLDMVVRGGPIAVLADPRGGANFGAIVRDLNSKLGASVVGSVVAVTVNPFNDNRKLAKKAKINLERLPLLADPTKEWMNAYRLLGPTVKRLSVKCIIIDLGSRGTIEEVIELEDPASAADQLIYALQNRRK